MTVPRDGYPHTLRRLYDHIDAISVNNRCLIPINSLHEVSDEEQMIVFSALTIDGELRVEGELRVVSWPA